MAQLIDGRSIANEMQQEICKSIVRLQGRPPGLAFICVGDNPASKSYIGMKKKACEAVGIRSFDLELSSTIHRLELLHQIEELNQNAEVDGILIQLPLPHSLLTPEILESVLPTKDVDGFHPLNLGKLLLGESDGFYPCTPLGIKILLARAQIEVAGKHVVIVGRSNIVGKPLAALLMQKREGCNATVTIAHKETKNLNQVCRSADILIAAMGNPHFIKKEMVRPGAIVIDVGINRVNGRIVGDVDFDEVRTVASRITPVPGGVGPMTIAALLSNTLLSRMRI